MWEEKEDLAGATSGIGINQQVKKGNATSGKEKNATGGKGNATSGKEKNITGVFWQILELVHDTGD